MSQHAVFYLKFCLLLSYNGVLCLLMLTINCTLHNYCTTIVHTCFRTENAGYVCRLIKILLEKINGKCKCVFSLHQEGFFRIYFVPSISEKLNYLYNTFKHYSYFQKTFMHFSG